MKMNLFILILKRNMKLTNVFALIFTVFFSALSFGQNKDIVLDKIVAQIGDNIILLSDIKVEISRMKAFGDTIPVNAECLVLEETMFQKLLLHQAKIDSIVINDAQVDAEMENRLRTIEQQIGSRQKLEEFYGKTTTELKIEFREAIKEKLLSQEMERNITSDVSVTPKEVKDFFSKIPVDSLPLINTQLSFQQIVHYPVITKVEKKLAFDQLEEARLLIVEGGANFSLLAKQISEDPGSARDGGKITATRGMMVPTFENTLFNLKVDEVSQVFESPYGYHIVKLIERKGDDYTVQHILIIPKVSDEALSKSADKIDSCYAALSAGTITWDEAVLKYSNDELTKQNRGIITNPITSEQTWDMENLSQVDQQIFVITDVMEKGDISSPNIYSDIYEHKQGVRIVRLMERTAPHTANLTDDYSLIKRAAENDKKQKIKDKWIISKISQSYIHIDPSFSDCLFKNSWNIMIK